MGGAAGIKGKKPSWFCTISLPRVLEYNFCFKRNTLYSVCPVLPGGLNEMISSSAPPALPTTFSGLFFHHFIHSSSKPLGSDAWSFHCDIQKCTTISYYWKGHNLEEQLSNLAPLLTSLSPTFKNYSCSLKVNVVVPFCGRWQLSNISSDARNWK